MGFRGAFSFGLAGFCFCMDTHDVLMYSYYV